MKHLKLLALCFSFLTVYTFGQNSDHGIRQLGNRKPSVLNIITLSNGTQITSRDLILAPSEIEKIYVLNQNEISKMYANSNADVVMNITPKANVILINLNQILDMYHIDQKYRDFAILFHDSIVENPETLLASKNLLKAVSIDTNKRTLNIKTKSYEKSLLFRKKRQQMKPENKVIKNF